MLDGSPCCTHQDILDGSRGILVDFLLEDGHGDVRDGGVQDEVHVQEILDVHQ